MGKRRTWIEPRARDWMEAAHIQMLSQKHGQPKLAKDSPLGIAVRLYARWGTNGKKAKSKWKRIDLDNRLKSILDVTAKAVGFEDSQVGHIRADKIEGDSERSEIDIWETDDLA